MRVNVYLNIVHGQSQFHGIAFLTYIFLLRSSLHRAVSYFFSETEKEVIMLKLSITKPCRRSVEHGYNYSVRSLILMVLESNYTQTVICEREYAGFWKRLGASAIDSIIIVAIIAPILTVVYGKDYWLGESTHNGYLDVLLNYIFPAIAIVLFWVYKSATPGKIYCRIRIIDVRSGKTPTPGQLIGRYLSYYVSLLPLGLGFFWVAFDKRKQGFHDKLSNTAVVVERDQKAPFIT